MNTLVYFAPVAWDSYLQRPHYVARHVLAGGGRVLWIDPYPTRFPMLRDLRRRAGTTLRTPRPDGLSVIAPRALPLEPLPAGQALNHALFGRALLERLRAECAGQTVTVGIGRPSSLALRALEVLRPSWSVFDALDDFPQFYDGAAQRAVAELESAIAERVQVVLTPSTGLWNKFAARGARRVMVPNACDMGALPPVPASRPAPPMVGFVGCISTWFDWPLVDRLAREMPQVPFELSGPCFEGPSAPLPSNVQLLPACTHDVAVQRMARFSVGLIPFRRNRLTAGVDPIKYYEYRGLGMPVLTTRFGEMALRGERDGVFFAEEAGALATTLERAARPLAHADVEAFRRAHSWERRFAGVAWFAKT